MKVEIKGKSGDNKMLFQHVKLILVTLQIMLRNIFYNTSPSKDVRIFSPKNLTSDISSSEVSIFLVLVHMGGRGVHT